MGYLAIALFVGFIIGYGVKSVATWEKWSKSDIESKKDLYSE